MLLVSILHHWLDPWILGRLPTTSDDITIYGPAMQLGTLLIHSSPAHSSNHTVHAPHPHNSFPMPVFQPLREGMFHSPPCALALASLFTLEPHSTVSHVCLHRCGRLSCNGNIVSGRMGRMGSDLNPNYLSVCISFCEMKQSRGHVADLSISRQTTCGSAFRCCTLAGRWSK